MLLLPDALRLQQGLRVRLIFPCCCQFRQSELALLSSFHNLQLLHPALCLLQLLAGLQGGGSCWAWLTWGRCERVCAWRWILVQPLLVWVPSWKPCVRVCPAWWRDAGWPWVTPYVRGPPVRWW